MQWKKHVSDGVQKGAKNSVGHKRFLYPIAHTIARRRSGTKLLRSRIPRNARIQPESYGWRLAPVTPSLMSKAEAAGAARAARAAAEVVTVGSLVCG